MLGFLLAQIIIGMGSSLDLEQKMTFLGHFCGCQSDPLWSVCLSLKPQMVGRRVLTVSKEWIDRRYAPYIFLTASHFENPRGPYIVKQEQEEGNQSGDDLSRSQRQRSHCLRYHHPIIQKALEYYAIGSSFRLDILVSNAVSWTIVSILEQWRPSRALPDLAV